MSLYALVGWCGIGLCGSSGSGGCSEGDKQTHGITNQSNIVIVTNFFWFDFLVFYSENVRFCVAKLDKVFCSRIWSWTNKISVVFSGVFSH